MSDDRWHRAAIRLASEDRPMVRSSQEFLLRLYEECEPWPTIREAIAAVLRGSPTPPHPGSDREGDME